MTGIYLNGRPLKRCEVCGKLTTDFTEVSFIETASGYVENTYTEIHCSECYDEQQGDIRECEI